MSTKAKTAAGAENPPVEEEAGLGYYFEIFRPDGEQTGTGHGAFSASRYVRMLAVIADEVKSDMAADNEMPNREREATLRSLKHPLTDGTVDGLLEDAKAIMQRIRRGAGQSQVEKEADWQEADDWLSRYSGGN